MKSPKLKISALNKLGKYLQAKSYSGGDATFISDNLTKFLAATEQPFPRGKRIPAKSYKLDMEPQDGRFDAKSGERKLEAKLLKQFRTGSSAFLNGVSRIVSFQVPLYSKQDRDGWGSIDLLGVEDAKNAYPVVIELKLAKETIEPPLRAVVEAVAYMLALRKNWDDFKQEWSTRTQREVLHSPKKLTAIILAPQAYWDKVMDDVWLSNSLLQLKDLVDKLACEEEYTIRFASIDAKFVHGDWKITGAAREITIPFSH